MKYQREKSVQRGMSLLELMIALGLSVVIVAALSELFVGISRSNIEMTKTNNQIENGRFATNLIVQDIKHAGYWGGHLPIWDDPTYEDDPDADPDHALTAMPDPCLAFTTPWTDNYINSAISLPLVVYSEAQIAATACNALLTNRAPGSDVLVIRHSSTCSPGEANCEAYDANKVYIYTSNCAPQLDVGTYYLLTQGPNTTITERSDDCDDLLAGTTVLSPARKYIQHIYYVQHDGGNGRALVRSVFDETGGTPVQQAPETLVDGIEGIRVEVALDNANAAGAVAYGDPIAWVDPDRRTSPTNRGDGVPDDQDAGSATNDFFFHCPTRPVALGGPCDQDDFRDVVAVKVYLLARTTTATAGYIDNKVYRTGSLTVNGTGLPNEDTASFIAGYKRHVFHNAVSLVNVAGRRESPP